MTRLNRFVLTAALMIGAVLPSAANAADPVRLRLNWMYYGSHAPFALGKDKGYFRDAGIDLDIRSGNGSGSAHRLVANNDSQFSYGSCASMVNLAAKGAPLISVAVIDAMGTEAVIVRPDAGVSKLGDLKGKSILTTANAGVNTFFPLVLKNGGLAEGDVKITNVPDGALVSSYLQGAGGSVGILGGLDDKPAEIKANGGAQPVTFAYSDFGVNQVGYCIVTNTETLGNNPDEDQGKAQARAVLDVTLGVLYSKANTDKKLGLHVASDWEDMLNLMKKYNDLQTDKPATAFYTNDYVK
jgi:NitT/TauT family transport system substrate-binding protein